jgi:hypothetical protein
VIYAESGKEFELGSVNTFGWSDVMVIGGEETSYICRYIDDCKWIINITSWKSFTIDGGILRYGDLNWLRNNASEYYFMVINGVDGYVKMRYIEIKFVSEMNNLIFIEGGIVCLEHVKIENEFINWKHTLINVQCHTSSVIIELFSLNITGCNCSLPDPKIVLCDSSFGRLFPIILNVSSLILQHSIFYREISTRLLGGCFQFYCYHLESGFISFSFF